MNRRSFIKTILSSAVALTGFKASAVTKPKIIPGTGGDYDENTDTQGLIIDEDSPAYNRKYDMDNKNVEPDVDGYYRVVIGTLDKDNFYHYKTTKNNLPVKKHISEDVLKSFTKTGLVLGEFVSPIKLPGTLYKDFIKTVTSVHLNNICCGFKNIVIETNDFNQDKIILASVKPMGDYGHYLKKALDNTDVTVSFSLRIIGRVNIKDDEIIVNAEKIITCDWDFQLTDIDFTPLPEEYVPKVDYDPEDCGKDMKKQLTSIYENFKSLNNS